ncbi:MAG: phosphotransferase family protein [Pyrinomonadaceae bacterium]
MKSETIEIRRGEELDLGNLREYLSSRFDEAESGIEVAQFPAGSSNLTYLVSLGGSEYVLRRPPFGNTVKTAHDMRREFEVLSKLSAVYVPAPKPILFCDDESVIGSEFYLMERRRGLIIRGSVNDSGVSRPRVSSPHVSKGSSQPQVQAVSPLDLTTQSGRIRICKSFIQNLADLHELDYKAAGLGELGKPEGYPRRQVEGWTKRYFAAKTHDHLELESAIKWLNKDIPNESGSSLVHNDYKFDNVMLDPDDLTRITAVLDWEMVTIGDPLMDLGTTLGYWMSPDAGEELMRMPFNPYLLMKNVSRRQLADMYAETSGRDVSNILYYYVFGTFKIAVIAQQIYARFVNGSTNDARFGHFDRFVGKLGEIAEQAIHSNRI